MDGAPVSFADLLRGLRERAGLSQEELAERAGLSGKAIGALERGERRRPYPHTVRALAQALGLADDERAALSAATRPGPAPEDPAPSPFLPASPTPLIGREAERDEVVALLRSGTRLVTLTGPGGVGKTSLALDVARALAPDFPDGAAFVELAPVRSARLVLPTLARALGAQQLAPPLAETLAASLGPRPRLVVLDNLEQVLDAASDLADLLALAPGLVVLATSRAPLRIRAERDHPLNPLAVPAGSGIADVAASPAAQVFLERARAAGGRVALDRAAADVAAICRRLDGLPLALELAAAHARLLSPAALLARLDSAISAPTSRDLPARQRTMRATLDWSHELLTAGEQVLLRRLSVFVDGFDLDAAQAVADGDVVPLLGGLVEQSLVVPTAGDRHRMLEPVRQYAAVRLTESGEADAVADRAAGHVRGWASEARLGLRGADQPSWLDRLQSEHGNLAATFERLLTAGQPAAGSRLAADTWLYWALRGNVTEGLAWAQRVRSSAADLAGGDQAALHLATAGLSFAAGDLRTTAAEGRAAAAAAEDADTHLEALVLAGSAEVFLGSFDDAAASLGEALRLARTDGRDWVLAHATMAHGQLLFATGDPAGAAATLAEAERLARAAGNPFTLATVVNMQATLALAADDDELALRLWSEAAELAVEVGTTWTLVYTVPGLAVVAARRGLAELAAELFAAGSATADASSVAVSFPPDLQFVQTYLSQVREALGEAAFLAAWGRGRGVRPADVPGLAEEISVRRGPG